MFFFGRGSRASKEGSTSSMKASVSPEPNVRRQQVQEENQQVYKYTLPEPIKYPEESISLQEFQTAREIFFQWETFLDNTDSLAPEIKQQLKEHSTTVSSDGKNILTPPLHTKMRCSVENGKTYITFTRLRFDKDQSKSPHSFRVEVDSSTELKHSFVVSERPKKNVNGDNTAGPSVYFSALQKKENKKAEYLHYAPARLDFYDSQDELGKKRYEEGFGRVVLCSQHQGVYHCQAKNQQGKEIEWFADSSSFDNEDSLKQKATRYFLSMGVLPAEISIRVKWSFPDPFFDDLDNALPVATLYKSGRSVGAIRRFDNVEFAKYPVTSVFSLYPHLYNAPPQDKVITEMLYLGMSLTRCLDEYKVVYKGGLSFRSQVPSEKISFLYFESDRGIYYQTKETNEPILLTDDKAATDALGAYLRNLYLDDEIPNVEWKKALLRNHKDYLRELFEHAIGICDAVYERHQKNVCIVDIKPDNFVCSKSPHPPHSLSTVAIDTDSFVEKGENVKFYTRKYAPNFLALNSKVSFATDTYSTGKVIEDLFFGLETAKDKKITGKMMKQVDELIWALCAEMTSYTHSPPLAEWCLPLSSVSNILKVCRLHEDCLFVDFALTCIHVLKENQYKMSPVDYKARWAMLGHLCKYLSEQQTPLTEPLSYPVQEVLLQFMYNKTLNDIKGWNYQQIIQKILDPNGGILFAYTVLASLESTHKKNNTLLMTCLKRLFTQENLTKDDIIEERGPIITSIQNAKAFEPYSRANIFEQYDHIQQILFEVPSNLKPSKEVQQLVHQINQFFPQYITSAQVVSNIVKACQVSALRDELKNGIRYMQEKHNSLFYQNGKKAVYNFLTELIAQNVQKEMTTEAIQEEKRKFLGEQGEQYKCSFWTQHKSNSLRSKIFDPPANNTRQPY